MSGIAQALLGGGLIGAAAVLLMAFEGRIVGSAAAASPWFPRLASSPRAQCAPPYKDFTVPLRA